MHKQICLSCFDPKSFGVVCPALETAVHTCSSANLFWKILQNSFVPETLFNNLQAHSVQLHQKQDPSTGSLVKIFRHFSWKLFLKLVFSISLYFAERRYFKKFQKYFLFHLRRSFRSRDIQFSSVFSLPFHSF